MEPNKDFIRVAVLGLCSSIFLVILKFTVGIAANSYTVMADGVESLCDTFSDTMLLLGVRVWSAPADDKHPYGHMKIETIVTAVVGLFLFAVGLLIMYRGVSALVVSDDKSHVVGKLSVIAPIVAIVLKETIFRISVRVSKRIQSSSLLANAWHHRSDAITSLVTLVAVVLSIINPKLQIIDYIGSVICSVIILKIAYNIISPTISELSDSRDSMNSSSKIEEALKNVSRIRGVHKIRTRKMGSAVFADMHVLVDGSISVKEGHDVADKVQIVLKNHIPSLVDVVVHIEPFGEETSDD